MRTRTVAVGSLAAALLAGGGALAFRHELAPLPPGMRVAALAPVPVVAAVVDQRDMPIYVTGVGTVVAFNTVAVRAQIPGQIVSVDFTEGQLVRTGDLLAQIDARPYQAQIDQLTAIRDRDQAQLANALQSLARYQSLFQKGYGTRQLLDAHKTQVLQLQHAVKASEALISAAKVQLGFTRLTSPIDGVTGIRQVDIGNLVSPANGGALVVVTQVEPISLIFTLPQTMLPRIQEQQLKATSPLTVIAYSQDDSIKLDEGTLGVVNNEMVQATGAIQLKANFPNTAKRLWPGQQVNARLLLDTRPRVPTVPASAVLQGPNGSYAYVIGPDNTVAIRQVTVAQISDGQALIDAGLEANERVVVDGHHKLRPGMAVTILDGKAAEAHDKQGAEQPPMP